MKRPSQGSKGGRVSRSAGRTRRALVVSAALLVAVFACLQLPPVQRAIAERIVAAVNRSAQVRIRVEGVAGFLPFRVRLDRLEVGDPAGSWLVAREVSARVDPLALAAGRVRLAELSVHSARLSRLPEVASDPAARHGFPVGVAIDALALSDLTLDPLSLHVARAEGGLAWDRIDAAVSGRLVVRGEATAGEGPEHSFEADLRLDPPRAGANQRFSISGVLREPPGSPIARVHAESEGTADLTSARVDARLEYRLEAGASESGLASWLRHGASGQARLSASRGRLSVEAVSGTLGEVRVSGRAGYEWETGMLDATVSADSRDLSLQAPTGLPLRGEARLHLQAGGPLDALRVQATLGSKRLFIRDSGELQLLAKVNLEATEGVFEGSVEARLGAAEAEPARLAFRVAGLGGPRIEVRQATLVAPGARAEGALWYRPEPADWETRLTVNAFDLGALRAWTGTQVAGSLDADILAEGEANSVRLKGRAEARDLLVGPVAVDHLELRGQGPLEDLHLSAGARGEVGRSFSLDLQGTAALHESSWKLEVASLKGRYDTRPILARRPLRLRGSKANLELSGLDLKVGDGSLQADLKRSEDAIDGEVRLRSWTLDLAGRDAQRPWKASLDGVVSLSSSPASPQVRADLDLELGPSGKLHVQASSASLKAWLRGDPSAPLAAKIQGAVDLSEHEEFLTPVGVFAGGSMRADIGMSGTRARPLVEGAFELSDMGFEAVAAGVSLRAMSLRLEGEGSHVRLQSLHAEGARGGAVTADGDLDFSSGMQAPVCHLRVQAAGLRPFESDRLDAELAGELRAVVSPAGGMLDGTLRLERAELSLPETLPPEIPVLEVEERHARGARPARTAPRAPWASRVALGVAVEAPGRVFVRREEFDTEWKGKLHLGGTLAQPLPDGTLRTVRGTVRLAGMAFRVVKGAITLDGRAKVDPILDVAAETRRNSILARVLVSGRASHPTITLESEPAMPRDEIVSHLLFGKASGGLSAMQAVQLADAVAGLTGKSHRLGFLGGARRKLGADVLEFESDATGGSAVRVGKYLREGVYVSVDQGLSEGSGSATVQVDLSPRVRLQTEVGADQRNSVELNWRWDY